MATPPVTLSVAKFDPGCTRYIGAGAMMVAFGFLPAMFLAAGKMAPAAGFGALTLALVTAVLLGSRAVPAGHLTIAEGRLHYTAVRGAPFEAALSDVRTVHLQLRGRRLPVPFVHPDQARDVTNIVIRFRRGRPLTLDPMRFEIPADQLVKLLYAALTETGVAREVARESIARSGWFALGCLAIGALAVAIPIIALVSC